MPILGPTIERSRLPANGATLRSANIAAAVLAMSSTVAFAQQAQRLPSVISPNLPGQTDRFSEQTLRKEQPTIRSPRSSQASKTADTKPLLKLKGIRIEGAHTLAGDEIGATYQRFLGKTVSEADLVAITEAIAERYRAAGYHLSRAIVPVQDIKNGTVVVQVIEGRITEIAVEGVGTEQFGIRQLLAPILADTPSRLSTLERQLLLANDRPGVRIADAALEELGQGSGRFKLTVYAETWRIYSSIGLDNTGSVAVGPLQAYSTTAFNSMLVPGDSATASFSTVPGSPRELTFGRISYDAPIGIDSWRLGGSISRSLIFPGDDRREFHTRTDFDTAEVRASYSPIQQQNQALWLTAALGVTYSTERDDFGSTYKDKIRTASLTADYRLHDPLGGWNYLTLTYRQGLGLADASRKADDNLSRFGGSGIFSVLNGSITHYQPLIENWSLKLAAAGQLSSNALLTSQQFFLGAGTFGRGFDSGLLSGDNGIAGTAELRFDQKLDLGFAKGYQLYGFVDAGAVQNFGQPKDSYQSLSSVGAGIRLFLDRDLQAGIAVATPLHYHGPGNGGRGTTILFSLSKAFKFCPERPSLGCA